MGKSISLAPYKTIYLGSPIWLYSPAPPIWAFAKEHDVSEKNVILFTTYNSRFDQEPIDDFERLVKRNGAISFTHRAVLRGRMGRQLSTREMLEAYDLLAP